MKIAISSGKGGVGKTFVATCLADVISDKQPVTLIDCDVEAPNAHLFLRADQPDQCREMLSCIEGVDPARCDRCGKCAEACYFNAIAIGKKSAMTFPELCRWCGACQIVCPHQALKVGRRPIGELFNGQTGAIDLHWARLQTGAGGMTTRLIDKLKRRDTHALTLLDSPPGTSCPVVHTVRDADCVVLVTDPTRFGVHDLKLSVRMCRSMGIEPCVVVNRAGIGDLDALVDWCGHERLDIVGTINDQREIAEYYSAGKLATRYLPDVKEVFEQIALAITDRKPVMTPAAGDDRAETVYLSEPKRTLPEDEAVEGQGKSAEVLVVSGKGGSGKTSLAACFSQLAQSTVADCDVDAADLHLLFAPEVIECDDFIGGRLMRIDPDKCVQCGRCKDVCRFDAIEKTASNGYAVVEGNCEGCGACLHICLAGAIETEASNDGRWYVSAVRAGSMSHATLSPGRENSGKLVTLVRKNTGLISDKNDSALTVLDGAPGTGCPVIASMNGVRFAVLVAEPTISGMHDLRRIYDLAQHFKVPCGVVINKADINLDVTIAIETFAEQQKIIMLGRLPYSPLFTEAQQTGQTVLEYGPNSDVAEQIQTIWEKVIQNLYERKFVE